MCVDRELRVAVGHASKWHTSYNRPGLHSFIGRDFTIVYEERRARTEDWCVKDNPAEFSWIRPTKTGNGFRIFRIAFVVHFTLNSLLTHHDLDLEELWRRTRLSILFWRMCWGCVLKWTAQTVVTILECSCRQTSRSSLWRRYTVVRGNVPLTWCCVGPSFVGFQKLKRARSSRS